MPEGHTIHRLALDCRERFAGRLVRVSSPQGKFADSAALLDGTVLHTADAHGKHLFLGFLGLGFHGAGGGEQVGWVHIHLGLIGKVTFDGVASGTVRLRIEAGGAAEGRDGHGEAGSAAGPGTTMDLRGPAACELITDDEKRAVHARLGPDPLRPGDDPDRAYARISRSRVPVAALLMDQRVLAGVGNVYRAEVLFRHGVDPFLPGRDLGRGLWDAMWADLATLMRQGVRTGRIDTVRPEHEPEAMGRPPRRDDHGGEVYVYRRTGLPCLVCGTPVLTLPLAARNLFWCPTCQPPAAAR
ncbi:Fpg/Nei family DNA glycosylase [Streptomyces sp. HPF1205]|uniref:Fpg/Nei family DNA glycosylase n=1 Tax=Streptomyces sp. HPF1205 TaxID=2873262 RepID=UPI001CEC0627|nr:zinc finger domain-containing protein [Streptomyces sp. HPF1205]